MSVQTRKKVEEVVRENLSDSYEITSTESVYGFGVTKDGETLAKTEAVSDGTVYVTIYPYRDREACGVIEKACWEHSQVYSRVLS